MKKLTAIIICIVFCLLPAIRSEAAEIPVLGSKIDDFDAVYYAVQNPDVVAVFGTDAEKLYDHYLKCGKAEGRLPHAGAVVTKETTTDYFDPIYYAINNPDVVKAFGTDAEALYFHYNTIGKTEGRAPNDGTPMKINPKKEEIEEKKDQDETETIDDTSDEVIETIEKEAETSSVDVDTDKKNIIGEIGKKIFVLDTKLPYKKVNSIMGTTLAGSIDITDAKVIKSYNDWMYLRLKAEKPAIHKGVMIFYPDVALYNEDDMVVQTITISMFPFEGEYYGLIEPLDDGEYTIRIK